VATPMNIENRRHEAMHLLAAARITAVPYGNAWWLVGDGISHVVGELAGVSPAHLTRFAVVNR